MKLFTLSLPLSLPLSLSLSLLSFSEESSCIVCHDGPQDLLQKSAHPQLSCADCHNGDEKAGDMAEAHSADKNFIGRPSPKLLATMCGSCHDKATPAWLRSPHFHAFDKGDRGATCADCHARAGMLSSHAIFTDDEEGSPTSRPLVAQSCARCHSDAGTMRRSGLRIDQLSLYERSAHGRNVASGGGDAATCADCHEPHSSPSRSDPLSATHPRNQSASCGKCHGDEKKMKPHDRSWKLVAKYDASPHARNLDLGAPSCADCHGAHFSHVPGPEAMRDHCGRCHEGPLRELLAGPHGPAEWMDPASAANAPVHCEHCHGAHGAKRPEAPWGQTVCRECHEPGSHEVLGGDEMTAVSSAVKARLFELHGLLDTARSRGHDFGPRCEALDALDSKYRELGALAHGVSPARCRAAAAAFEKDAEELKTRLKPLAEPERPRGWLAGMWAFVVVGVALMWARARRAARGA